MATLVRHDTLASELLHEAETIHEAASLADEVAAEAAVALDAAAAREQEHAADDYLCSEMLSPVAAEVHGSSASALEGAAIAESLVSFAMQARSRHPPPRSLSLSLSLSLSAPPESARASRARVRGPLPLLSSPAARCRRAQEARPLSDAEESAQLLST